MHDGLLAELVGGPGHAAAVVAVGGGEEGGLAEVGGELVGGQVVVGAVGNVLAGLVGNVVGHGEGATQDLERVEAKAAALVLDAEVAQAQASRLAVKTSKRGHGVLGEALVESTRLGNVIQGHDAEVGIIALGHLVDGPLDLLDH